MNFVLIFAHVLFTLFFLIARSQGYVGHARSRCAEPGVRGSRAQPMRAARGTWATRADDARSQGYEPFYRAFQVKKYTAVFGPLGLVWPSGGPSGCSVCARADAWYRETPRTPSSQNSFLQVPFVPAFTVWNMFSG